MGAQEIVSALGCAFLSVCAVHGFFSCEVYAVIPTRHIEILLVAGYLKVAVSFGYLMAAFGLLVFSIPEPIWTRRVSPTGGLERNSVAMVFVGFCLFLFIIVSLIHSLDLVNISVDDCVSRA